MVRRRRDRQRGHALVLALFVIAVVMAAGAVLAASLAERMERVEAASRSLHLTALLDAALAQTLAELSRNPAYPGTRGEVPLGDGAVATAVTRVGTARARVDLRAVYGTGGRAARAEVVLFPVLEVVRWEPVGFQP